MAEDSVAYHLAVQTSEIAAMSKLKDNYENEVAGVKLTVTPKVYREV